MRYLEHGETAHEEEASEGESQSKLGWLQNDCRKTDHECEHKEEDGEQQRHHETLGSFETVQRNAKQNTKRAPGGGGEGTNTKCYRLRGGGVREGGYRNKQVSCHTGKRERKTTPR